VGLRRLIDGRHPAEEDPSTIGRSVTGEFVPDDSDSVATTQQRHASEHGGEREERSEPRG
jgi:hypothetical protein